MSRSNRCTLLVVISLTFIAMVSTSQRAFSQTCTFSRTAKSDSAAKPVKPPNFLQNGDFKIVGLQGNSGDVGDGTDEFTRWIYDYKSDLEIINLLDPAKLTVAKLDVVFEGGGGNDDIGIHGLEQLLAFPGGVFGDQSYNLLSKYTPKSIVDKINEVQTSGSTGVTAQKGELLMGYQDDALVKSASLELVFNQECPVVCTASKNGFAGSLINWKNDAGGAFSVGTNWEGDRRPGPDSIAVFGIGGKSYTVSMDAPVSNGRLDVDGDISVLQLNRNAYELSSATRDFPGGVCSNPESILVYGKSGRASGLVIANGTVLAPGDVLVGTEGPEQATLTVTGDSARLFVATQGGLGELKVGSGPGSVGDVLIELGASLVSYLTEQFASEPSSSGSITVDGPGSKWQSTFSTLGAFGTAEGRIGNRAAADIGSLVLASGDGSSGSLIVSDSGSVLTIGSEINIGVNGEGLLTIEKAGRLEGLSASFVRIGVGSLGKGHVRVVGPGSILDVDGIVEVGREGIGALTATAGALVTTRDLVVAALDSGQVTIDGPGTVLKIIDDSFATKIGEAGPGRIDITNGAMLESAGDINVGAESNTDKDPALGTMSVLGAGSKVTAPNIFIGVKSVGEVFVESAIVSLKGLVVGFEDFKKDLNATPSRLEIGHGAEVNAIDLAVGRGHGVVRIRSGSTLGVQYGVVAQNDTSDGKIFVEDPGSELIVVGRLILGNQGTALLNVFSGGSATIGTLIVGKGTIIGSNLKVHKRFSKVSGGSEPDQIETESLFLGEGATLDVANVSLGDGGTLGGSGSYPFPLVNGGEISPGDSALATGTLQLDSSYVQLESGSLRIELGGADEAEFDRLVVSGKAELAGKLILELIEIPEIAVGTGLEIVSADSISGTFSEVVVGPGLAVDVEYSASSVTVRITAPVSVEDDGTGSEIAREFRLDANYPNPFNESTTIVYSIPESADIQFTIVDMLGRVARHLRLGVKQAGEHTMTLERDGLPSGVYHVRMTAGRHTGTKQMTILR